MKLKTIMHAHVYFLDETASILEAIQLMERQSIRHIPIVNAAHHVVGIVSDRDIRDIRPSILVPKTDETLFMKPISSIMSVPVLTGHQEDDVQESARLFFFRIVLVVFLLRQTAN